MRLTRGLLAVGWGAAILFVLTASIADHPLRQALRVRTNLIVVSPQGWAFFTRSPREPVDRIFQQRGPQLSPVTYANSSMRNRFGISRAARALNVELASLLAQLPRGSWVECEEALEDCVARMESNAPVVANASVMQKLCGDLVVERRPPVPWAWSSSARPIHMSGQVTRFKVRCGGEDV
jgi:antimicrobial peptide system SdpA family protein